MILDSKPLILDEDVPRVSRPIPFAPNRPSPCHLAGGMINLVSKYSLSGFDVRPSCAQIHAGVEPGATGQLDCLRRFALCREGVQWNNHQGDRESGWNQRGPGLQILPNETGAVCRYPRGK